MGTAAAANMEVATASWWWYLSRNHTTWKEVWESGGTSNMVFSLMGVSLAMLAILVTSYIAHLIHIMQRVRKNRQDREEKAKEMKKLRRKRLTTSAYYNNLIKTSLGSIQSIQSGDFLEDALLSGLYTLYSVFSSKYTTKA